MKIKILGILFLISSVFLLVGCQEKQVGTSTYEFNGFEIAETATAECGTYYSFEKPDVLCAGEKATLMITVKNGETLIPHDNKEVYFDSVGSYTITYTASYDGQKTSKTTNITTTDTTAPVFLNTLRTSVRHNQVVKIADYVKTKDVSKIKNIVYAITKEDGTELPNGMFNAETTELCVSDETICRVKLSVSATDIYGNTGTEDFIISLTTQPIYGMFNFNWFETGATEIGGVSVSTNAINTYEMQLVEENGEKYVCITVNTMAKNQYITVNLSDVLIGEYSKFDYVDVEMLLDCTMNGGNAGLVGAEFSAAPQGVGQNVFKEKQGQWYTYRYSGEAAQISMAKSGGISLLFKPWAEQTITIKIKNIVGRYADKELFGDGDVRFDFEDILGLSASEVKNVTFDGETVEDLNDFIPKKTGILTFTACKKGYKETQVCVKVLVVPVMVDNEDGVDNNYEWEWQ